MKNRQIAVIGAGLMGHGIALTLARAGQYVAVTDPMADARAALPGRVADSLRLMGVGEVESARVLKRIEVFDGIAGAVRAADFVFEAAPEKMALKQSIFAEIEAAAPPAAVLCSNTSVMPITEIMSGLRDKARALGTHWWNPPHLIPLVEVIRTADTSETAMAATMALLADAGKTPVRVEKDVPGFIGNRLQHALWREAISLVERGICDAAAVDAVIKASFGRQAGGLGAVGECRSGRHGSDAGHSQHRSGRSGKPPGSLALASADGGGGAVGDEIRRRVPEMDAGTGASLAGKGCQPSVGA